MTKTQIKAKMKKLAKKLNKIIPILESLEEEFNDLECEVEVEFDEIEPFGNRDELTDRQVKRFDYLETLLCDIGEIRSNLEDACDDLSTVTDYVDYKWNE